MYLEKIYLPVLINMYTMFIQYSECTSCAVRLKCIPRSRSKNVPRSHLGLGSKLGNALFLSCCRHDLKRPNAEEWTRSILSASMHMLSKCGRSAVISPARRLAMYSYVFSDGFSHLMGCTSMLLRHSRPVLSGRLSSAFPPRRVPSPARPPLSPRPSYWA